MVCQKGLSQKSNKNNLNIKQVCVSKPGEQ